MELDTRSNNKDLPGKEALIQCKEVVTTIEAADYFVDQFEKKLESAGKLEAAQPAVANIREFADMVRKQRETKSDYWSGQAGPLNDFQNFQQNMAEEAATFIASKVEGPIKVDFAINDLAQLRRGYSVNKNALDTETAKAMDTLLNAHLAKNNLISKGSIIYAGDEKGQIRRDSKGEPILADVEKARQVVSDSAKGFEQYLQQTGKEIHVQTKQHEFPAQKPAVTEAQAPESAPAAATPETPQTSHSGPGGPSS